MNSTLQLSQNKKDATQKSQIWFILSEVEYYLEYIRKGGFSTKLLFYVLNSNRQALKEILLIIF